MSRHLQAGTRFYVHALAHQTNDAVYSRETACLFTVGETATTSSTISVSEYDYPYPSAEPLAQYGNEYPSKQACETFDLTGGTGAGITLLGGSFTIEGLTAGQPYYVRMSARNKWVGQSPFTDTEPPMEVPRQSPGLVSDVQVYQGAVAGSSLQVSWSGANVAGSTVTGYLVEHFTRNEASPHFEVQERQLVQTAGTPTSGSFTLGFGDVNVALPGTVGAENGAKYISTSEDLTAHISRGDFIRVGGTNYLVHATEPFTPFRLPLAQASGAASATPDALGTVDTTYEGTTAAGLTAYKQAVTTDLGYMTTATELQTALQNLPSIGQVGVSRTCYDGGTAHCTLGFTWTVTFVSEVGKQPLLVKNGRLLTGIDGAVENPTIQLMNEGVQPQDYSATVVPASNGLLSFPLQSLNMGSPYYVRVSASSDRGYGPFIASAHPVAPLAVPGAVPDVMIRPWNGTALEVEYEEAASNGGDIITHYEIEWDISADFSSSEKKSQEYAISHHIQKIATSTHTGPITGEFTVSLGDFHGEYLTQIGGVDGNDDLTYVNVAQNKLLCTDCATEFDTGLESLAITDADAKLFKYLGTGVRFTAFLSNSTHNETCTLAVASTTFSVATTSVVVESGHACNSIFDASSSTLSLLSAVTRADPSTGNSMGLASLSANIARGDYIRVGGEEFRICLDTTIGAYDAANLPICSKDDAWTEASYTGGGAYGAMDLVKIPAYKLDTALGWVYDTALGATVLVTDADLTTRIARGDYIRLGHPIDGQTFRVSTDTQQEFSSTRVPLASVEDPTKPQSVSEIGLVGSTREVQTFTIDPTAAAPSVGAGGFRLKFDTEITFKTTSGGDPGCLMWNSGSATTDTDAVKAELEELSNVDTVTVSRTPTLAGGMTYSVTFIGTKVRGNVPLLEVLNINVDDCQEFGVTMDAPVVLVSEYAYAPLYEVQTTSNLAYDATAADMKFAIEALTQVCTVDVSRSISGNGFDWSVTFTAEEGNSTNSLLDAMSANRYLLGQGDPYLAYDSSTNPPHEAFVSVSGVNKVLINTPNTGLPYYVRVRAANSRGAGEWSVSTPSSLAPAVQRPSLPQLTSLQVISDSEMLVMWGPPMNAGGNGVTKYRIEWDTVSTFDSAMHQSSIVLSSASTPVVDVQHISTAVPSDMHMGGTFTVTYLGQKTAQLPYDISGAGMTTALEGLCTVDDVTVTRNTIARGHTWLVTFTSMRYEGNLQTRHDSRHQILDSHRLSVDGSHLLMCEYQDNPHTGSVIDRKVCMHTKEYGTENIQASTVDIATNSETQAFSCTDADTSDGSFDLEYMGHSVTIPSASTASEVETLIESLDSIGDVTVTFATDEVCDATPGERNVQIRFDSELGDLPIIALSATLAGVALTPAEELTKGRTQAVVGRLPYHKIITEERDASVPWFVRVSAFNTVGYGVANPTIPESVKPTTTVPMIARDVIASTHDSNEMLVQWTIPESFGGAINSEMSYEVQWDTVDSLTSQCGDRAEVQEFKLAASAAEAGAGTFKFTYQGLESTCIAATASAALVQSTLQDLTPYTGLTVSRCGDGTSGSDYGYTHTVTFTATNAEAPHGDVSQITAVSCAADTLTIAESTTTHGPDQSSLQGQGRSSDCTAALVEALGFATTTDEDSLALASDMNLDNSTKRAIVIKHLTPGIKYFVRIVAINTAGRSPVSHQTASSVAVPAGFPGVPTAATLSPETETSLLVQYAPPYNVKREGSNGKKVTGYVVELANRVYEEQTITVKATGGPITQGQFQMRLTNDGVTATTIALDWNSAAAAVELALEELQNVDGVSVLRSALGVASAPNGYVYTVTFDGAVLCNGNIQELVVFEACSDCKAFLPSSNGESVVSDTATNGVAGFVPEVVTVTTLTPESGTYDLSVDYNGTFTKKLCTDCATVSPHSQTVSTGATDFTALIRRGDKLWIEGEIFKVDDFADFTCSELPLDSYHRSGAAGVDIWVEDTFLGNVVATASSSTIDTDDDLTNDLAVGDFIRLGGEDTGLEFTVKAITTSSIDLGNPVDQQCGPDEFAAVTCDSLNYNGETSYQKTLYMRKKVAVAYDVDAYDLDAALETLPGVGTVDVSRTGPDDNDGFVWTITFTSLNGPFKCPDYLSTATTPTVASPCLVSQLTRGSLAALLTGATASVSTSFSSTLALGNGIIQQGVAPSFDTTARTLTIGSGVHEVQVLSTSADENNLGGTFTVNYDKDSVSAITPVTFIHDVTAIDMKKILERDLPTVGIVDVSREADIAGHGLTWSITFVTNFGDLPDIEVDGSHLSGTTAAIAQQEAVKGVPPAPQAVAEDLTTGVAYHVRVAAVNEEGQGDWTSDYMNNGGEGMLPLQQVVQQPPMAPTIDMAAPISKTRVELSFTPPANRGSDIHSYRLEWVTGTSFGVPEEQVISLTNSLDDDTDGYFMLEYADERTTQLEHDCSATRMQTALQNLATLGTVSVTRTSLETAPTGYEWTITFVQDVGTLAEHSADPSNGLEIVGCSSFPCAPPAVTSIKELGTIEASITTVMTGASTRNYGFVDLDTSTNCGSHIVGTPSSVQLIQLGQAAMTSAVYTAGSYTLSLDGGPTACIEHDADTNAVKTALEALPNVHTVSVELVDLSPPYQSYTRTTDGGFAHDYRVFFWGKYPKGRWPTLKVDAFGAGSCTPFSPAIAPAAEIHSLKVEGPCSNGNDEVQVIVADGTTALGGTFVATFQGQRTYPIPIASTAAEVEVKLEAAFTAVDVEVSLTDHNTYGKAWAVTFISHEGDQDLMTVNDDYTTGTDATVAVYDMVVATSTCDKANIMGDFTLQMDTELTEPLRHDATHAKVVQELEKLNVFGKVEFLGTAAGRVSLSQTVLVQSNIATVYTCGIASLPACLAAHDLRTAVAVADNNRPGDTVTIPKLEGEFIQTGTNNAATVTFPASLAATIEVNDKFMIGDSDLTFTVQAVAGADITLTPNYDGATVAAAHPSVAINGLAYTVQAVAANSFTLDRGYQSTDTAAAQEVQIAAIGELVQSKQQLPGLLSLTTDKYVVAATINSAVLTFSSVDGITGGDKFTIAGQEMEVSSVNAATKQVTMLQLYNSYSVVNGAPSTNVFGNVVTTTADLSAILDTIDHNKVWLGLDEYEVVSLTATSVTVSGVVTSEYHGESGYYWANGYERSMVLKVPLGSPSTFRAIPQPNWRGTGARLQVQRPAGVAANSFVLGDVPEVQTLALRDTTTGTGTFTLEIAPGVETGNINWGASPADMELALEALSVVDQVTVERSGDGSATSRYGYVYTMLFWGRSAYPNIPQLTHVPGVSLNPTAKIVHDTVQEGVASAAFLQQYVALEENQQYSLRLSAANAEDMVPQAPLWWWKPPCSASSPVLLVPWLSATVTPLILLVSSTTPPFATAVSPSPSTASSGTARPISTPPVPTTAKAPSSSCTRCSTSLSPSGVAIPLRSALEVSSSLGVAGPPLTLHGTSLQPTWPTPSRA